MSITFSAILIVLDYDYYFKRGIAFYGLTVDLAYGKFNLYLADLEDYLTGVYLFIPPPMAEVPTNSRPILSALPLLPVGILISATNGLLGSVNTLTV